MYLLIENNQVKQRPYTVKDLRSDNSQTSFPDTITDALLATFNVFPVKPTERPQFDPMTQNLAEGTPVLQSGEWVQVWTITDATAEELAQLQAERAEQTRQQRQAAYQQEADPLFFKWQRGEATEQEWLDKIAEIKTRFPD